jgi:hypothetical protein
MQDISEIMESYNKIAEDLLSEAMSDNSKELADTEINNILIQAEEIWKTSYMSFFDDLSGDGILSIYEEAAGNAFYNVPEVIETKLLSLGKRGEAFIESLIIAVKNPEPDERTWDLALAAVKTAASHRMFPVGSALLEAWTACDLSKEYFLEELKTAISRMDEQTINSAVQILDNCESIGVKEEYLMMAICGAPKEYAEVFPCLKRSFKRMDDRNMGASILGDYGDPRSVPVLRKYVLDNKDKLEKREYYAILSIIISLGGYTDDLILNSRTTE